MTAAPRFSRATLRCATDCGRLAAGLAASFPRGSRPASHVMPIRPLALLASSAALVAATSGFAQTPPCLGPFQDVQLSVPLVQADDFEGLAIDGDSAVVWTIRTGTFPWIYTLHFLARDPATGVWSARGARQVTSLLAATIAFRDGYLAFAERDPYQLVRVVRVDAAQGTWTKVGVIPFLDPFPPRLRMSEGYLLVSGAGSTVLYELAPTGISAVANLASINEAQVALEGARYALQREHWIEVHRRNAAGSFELEALITPPTGTLLEMLATPRLDRGRFVARFYQGPVGGPTSIGVWRLLPNPSGTVPVFDGRSSLDQLGVGNPSFSGVLANGTLVDFTSNGPCAASTNALVSIDLLDGQLVMLGGVLCDLGGVALPHHVRRLAYDGRTLGVCTESATGRHVLLAPLLAVDHDRDRDCAEDTREIAADPTLDLNQNGLLDATEQRGVDYCLPLGPNSQGQVATLEVIGTEASASRDLTAVARGLAPGALAIALTTAAPPSFPLLHPAGVPVCIDGPAVGRYAPTHADAQGVAVVPLRPSALPAPGGTAAALSGVTIGWQVLYRDAGSLAGTNAMAVVLY